jgi:hypothetical protein
MAVGQAFLWLLQFFPVSAILTGLHALFLNYYRRKKKVAIDSAFK